MKNGVLSMRVISKLVTGEIRQGGNQLVGLDLTMEGTPFM